MKLRFLFLLFLLVLLAPEAPVSAAQKVGDGRALPSGLQEDLDSDRDGLSDFQEIHK